MKVSLFAKTQMTGPAYADLGYEIYEALEREECTDGQLAALTAIRTCYQHLKPSDILEAEFKKYFKNKATDGKGGSEADRLIRHINQSGHTSTLEHISFTFHVEDVSRTLLAQVTRHRIGTSFSVQSQRYVKFESNSKSGGANFYTPARIEANEEAEGLYEKAMEMIQGVYDSLRVLGIPAEDARYVLPNAAMCNFTMTMNLTAALSFYAKRNNTTHAQKEIQDFAELVRDRIVEEEPWTKGIFDSVKESK